MFKVYISVILSSKTKCYQPNIDEQMLIITSNKKTIKKPQLITVIVTSENITTTYTTTTTTTTTTTNNNNNNVVSVFYQMLKGCFIPTVLLIRNICNDAYLLAIFMNHPWFGYNHLPDPADPILLFINKKKLLTFLKHFLFGFIGNLSFMNRNYCSISFKSLTGILHIILGIMILNIICAATLNGSC